jgi:HB1, ASXL, restriction endonuclease HTH domain
MNRGYPLTLGIQTGLGLEPSTRTGEGMTYYEAALQVLRSAGHPMSTREITDQAIAEGLISPRGKTPYATMAARLYLRFRNDSELVKLATPGNGRAKRDSVRWTLRGTG